MNADQFRIELNNIKNQIVNKFNPKEIVLFGSLAKGTFRSNSDIDLCIIKDTDNKRDLITKIYTEIDCNVPYDIVVYTISEWEKFKNDKDTFVYSIIKNGVKIYG